MGLQPRFPIWQHTENIQNHNFVTYENRLLLLFTAYKREQARRGTCVEATFCCLLSLFRNIYLLLNFLYTLRYFLTHIHASGVVVSAERIKGTNLHPSLTELLSSVKVKSTYICSNLFRQEKMAFKINLLKPVPNRCHEISEKHKRITKNTVIFPHISFRQLLRSASCSQLLVLIQRFSFGPFYLNSLLMFIHITKDK